MSEHTPGPWRVSHKTSIGTNHFIAVGPPSKLAVANVWDFGLPRSEADAVLIAAAPELLEALTGVLLDCPCDEDTTLRYQAAVDKARDAISKATGKELPA